MSVELTTREQNLLERIHELYPLPRLRTEREWLRFRGVGRLMLAKLHARGMVAPAAPVGLSTRALNTLRGSGVETSKAEVRKAFAASKLWHARGCGRLTLQELYQWALLPDQR